VFTFDLKRGKRIYMAIARGKRNNCDRRLKDGYYHTGNEVLRQFTKDVSFETGISYKQIGKELGYTTPCQFSDFVEGFNNAFGNTPNVWLTLIRISVKFQYPLDMSNYMHLIETKFLLDEADFLSDSEELIQYNSKNLKENKK